MSILVLPSIAFELYVEQVLTLSLPAGKSLP